MSTIIFYLISFYVRTVNKESLSSSRLHVIYTIPPCKQHSFLKSTHWRNTRRRAFHINRLLALHKVTFHLLFHFHSIDTKSSLQSPPNKEIQQKYSHCCTYTVDSTHTNTHSPAQHNTRKENCYQFIEKTIYLSLFRQSRMNRNGIHRSLQSIRMEMTQCMYK